MTRFFRLCVVSAASLGCLGFVSLVSGCNKDEPKKVKEDPPKTEPVPSDMVFNDFLPSGGQVALRVDGGGMEGGLPGNATAAAGTSDDPGAAGADDVAKLHVTDPGADPKVARKYAFAPGKADRRVIVLRQTLTQAGREQQQPALAMTVDFTAKAVKPAGATFEMKIVSVDIADKDKIDKAAAAQVAQMSQQLATFSGLVANFDIDAHGGIGEVSIQANEKMQKAGAQDLVESFQQAVELMLPPLPDEPIGVGAKWERVIDTAQGGMPQKGKHTFELKDLAADGTATVFATIASKVPKRPVPDPRMPKGAMMEVDTAGAYTYTFRFDHVSMKVVGELKKKVAITVPAEDGKAQTMVQEVKLVHTMQVPGAK